MSSFDCLVLIVSWFSLLGWPFCLALLVFWLLVQPQRIRSDLCFSEFSPFHSWLDWRELSPDSRASWRRLPVYHSCHPLSRVDYSQTVAPSPIGARVYPCSKVSFGQYFASGFVLDSA